MPNPVDNTTRHLTELCESYQYIQLNQKPTRIMPPSAYWRILMLNPPITTPSISSTSLNIFSVYRLNKLDDRTQPCLTPFLIWNSVVVPKLCCNNCWLFPIHLCYDLQLLIIYSNFLKTVYHFQVLDSVKCFGIVNERYIYTPLILLLKLFHVLFLGLKIPFTRTHFWSEYTF